MSGKGTPAGSAAKIINGTDGSDTIVGTDAADRIYGGLGEDALDGGDGDDLVSGGAGDDFIGEYVGGNDTFLGGTGDDELQGFLGDDLLSGGDGFDGAVYLYSGWLDGLTVGITVDLRIKGPQDTGAAGVDTLKSIEGLIGSQQTDLLIGDAQDNSLWGENGDDTIYGGRGDDFIRGATSAVPGGEDDRDLLVGGAGNDTIEAWFNEQSLGQVSTLLGGEGDDTLMGGAVMEGGAGADVLTSAVIGATLEGGDGDDTIFSSTGTIYGGDGNDVLQACAGRLDGGLGDDSIVGTEDDDRILGGGGQDVMRGGGGDDRFVFKAGDLTPLHNEHVQDFDAGDLIDLRKLVGDGVDLHFVDNLTGQAGEILVNGDAGSPTMIQIDISGGVVVNLATDGPYVPTEADFLI